MHFNFVGFESMRKLFKLMELENLLVDEKVLYFV